jgi:5-methylcytosine-specific restriction endonuclease McrA
MRNARAPLFRPPWAPTKRERLVAFRAEQERYHPRPPAAARGYGPDWNTLRNEILAAEPYCRHCARRGVERLAQMVDHIEPIRSAPERRLDPTNCQPLCWPCHRRKSNRSDGGFGRAPPGSRGLT